MINCRVSLRPACLVVASRVHSHHNRGDPRCGEPIHALATPIRNLGGREPDDAAALPPLPPSRLHQESIVVP